MKSINPATEEVIGDYPEHTWEQIEKAIASAKQAFSTWRFTPIDQRCALLRKTADLLRQRRATLAPLMTAEMGKTLTASEGEIDKVIFGCEYFAEHAPKFLADQPMPSDASSSYVRFDPLGIVLAIMPWNFPIWQALRFAVPALAAGNVVLLKHAPNVPGCALAVEKLLLDAGFPPSVFTSLLVAENAIAERIVAHPALAAITLTGSERAGSTVASIAAKSLKKTVMELGGSDPFIVLDDVDIPSIAASAAEARCQNNGESCIAAKRFIVHQSIASQFEEAFTAAMSALKIGDPMDRTTKVGPLARLDLLENLRRQVDATIAQGARLLLGGHRRPGKGFFFEPTVLTDVRPGMTAFEEETFGPVAAIIRAKDVDEAIQLANQSRYGLGASLWTSDLDRARKLSARIEAGGVFVNGIVKSDPRLPFGGTKNSGWGRELSEFGIREFVNIKTVWIR
ncbi:MAG: NAD-dependent succinate-semialdehyde dehydrogenase [Tepidisphaeraceae bacterium]|jgi:succinate-semialdehyde dehydrogenase/glutarate-semialdehyde dehydrogenase